MSLPAAGNIIRDVIGPVLAPEAFLVASGLFEVICAAISIAGSHPWD